MQIIEPRSFLDTFNDLCGSMPLNESVRRLEWDDDTVFEIKKALREMGQTRFVPLARKSSDAMISLPLYAGNGMVIKIIPRTYSDVSVNSIFKLPPVTVDSISGKNGEFLIKTYPWISPRGITMESVEHMRRQLGDLGLKFNTNDDQPRNIHRLPDKNGTLISVDEDIYSGSLVDDEFTQAWLDYVHSIFPVYASSEIPAQDDKTDFSFVSRHKREAESYQFTAFHVAEVDFTHFNM